MNMIIAGDGYNNIRCADSPNEAKPIPPYKKTNGQTCDDGKAHLILTNPPFGTSEAESLSEESAKSYEVPSTRGQSLFIQLMIRSAHAGSLIVTVIDEGVLNTASYAELRRHVLRTCRVEAVLELPEETFRPNKINVKSSVLVLRRRDESDEDMTDNYPIACMSVRSLGYEGSGNEIRGFDLNRLITEVAAIDVGKLEEGKLKEGYNWSAFRVQSKTIAADKSCRLDVRFWHPKVRALVNRLKDMPGVKTIKALNTIETRRGKGLSSAEYVSVSEGYAIFVKSGSNISKTGELVIDGADYVEESIYQEYVETKMILQEGDILLSSTGDGTLGKCCVYRNKDENGETRPGVPERHVTVIRVAQWEVCPEYLCDYIRKGFGRDQIDRLFTGSTGMVEVTPDEVNEVLVPPLPPIKEQEKISNRLRKSEKLAAEITEQSAAVLQDGEIEFRQTTLTAV
jgi:type I restriction enzyme M protein